MANATCFTQHAPFQGPPLIQNGQLTFQAHHVGWIIAGFFTIVATVASFWLIGKHLMWYTNKRQQRNIVRLLLMVPIYATVSLASFIFWNHAIPITLARDCYEAFVLYSFFYLLLQYLSPTIEGQKEVFRHVVLEKWVFPLGFVKYRPEDGLYFLQLMKWGVLQYCVIRPTTTLAAVILDIIGLYCEDSWSPGWGHVYITIIVSLSVTIAMYCLIQLYMPIAGQLAPHKPLLKLFSVKAVVFLTFWQATGLSVLSMFGVVKDTKYMTAEDINTGIAAILETFEMMCFAFVHVKAFSYHPYREGHKPSERTPRFRSFMHALDLRDMWREIWDGSVYMGRTIRGIEAEEETRRRIHFAKAMGRERELTEVKKWTKEGQVESEDHLLLDKHGRRLNRGGREIWLSEPDDRFGVAFEDEVDRERQRRETANEYDALYDLDQDTHQGHTRGRTSWWKGIYDRLSQSDTRDHEELRAAVPWRPPHNRRSRKHRGRDSEFPSLDSPPPPPSVMYEYSHLGKGQASVRLSHNAKPSGGEVRESHDTPKEHRVGHHYRHKSSAPRERRVESLPTDRRFQAPSKTIAAPRPMSASQSRHVEFLVSRDHGPHPGEGHALASNHDRDSLAVPSGVVRSDSLLARVFPNSTDGHTSSDGKTNPTSSQDTLSTYLMYPSPPSAEVIPSAQGEHAELFPAPMNSYSVVSDFSAQAQTSKSPPVSKNPNSRATQLTPMRDHTRPNIVLPMPLSPARYPVEPSRRAGDSRQQIQEWSEQQTTLDAGTITTSDNRRGARRHSTQIDQPLVRRSQASKRMYAPAEGYTATNNQPTSPSQRGQAQFSPTYDIGTDAMDPNWDISSDSSRYPSSPTGRFLPNLTTSPSPPSPSRPLRRSRDDVGKVRRAWS